MFLVTRPCENPPNHGPRSPGSESFAKMNSSGSCVPATGVAEDVGTVVALDAAEAAEVAVAVVDSSSSEQPTSATPARPRPARPAPEMKRRRETRESNECMDRPSADCVLMGMLLAETLPHITGTIRGGSGFVKKRSPTHVVVTSRRAARERDASS